MTDSTTPQSAAEPPFGAGVPAEAVEPVRLPQGLAHGPALDVRGLAVPYPVPPPQPVREAPAQIATSAAATSAVPGGASVTSTVQVPPAAQPLAAGAASGVPPAPGPQPSAAGVQASATPPPASVPPPASPPLPPSGAPPGTSAAKPPRRWWVALAHLAYLIPFPPGVIVTAVLWIWRRSRDPLMADQGREALNMQLTFWLAMGLLGVTCFATPLVPFVYVLGAVLCILAAIASASGDRHRYPWVFRFLT
ncbi:MAG: DUF4870 domain-containing protein [Planctomycetota bacterium]|nr:DUF4870 domain-containing protein [Planctomycetota bacterium]